VPVVQVSRRSARLGGAANVALNLRSLGAKAIVASIIGDDVQADDLLKLFSEQGLSSEGLVRSIGRRTTMKTRIISGDQHVVRVDEEMESEINEAEERNFVHNVVQLMHAQEPEVLIFEDYDKGVLTSGVIAGLIAEAHCLGIPVAVDPKRRHFFDYREADLFKPNLKELREGLKLDIDSGDIAAVKGAVKMMEARLVNATSLITLSEHGVYAHAGDEEVALPAHPRNVMDVSGAGDTVIAVAALCLALKLPLRTIAAWSNLSGGLVCEQVGVVPVRPEELLAEAQRLDLHASPSTVA
jgi:rfaE bifunctional protein kinase chain/domain